MATKNTQITWKSFYTLLVAIALYLLSMVIDSFTTEFKNLRNDIKEVRAGWVTHLESHNELVAKE